MLIPVVMLMSLVAVLAYAVNREKGVNTVLQGRESDIDHARYAAEAGLLALNARVQSLGCGATYPTAASPWSQSAFGSAAYSAYATTATGNTLTLVSTGTYKGSSVTLSRSSVFVYRASTRTYTLQPGSSGIDTYIEENSSANNGSEDKLKIKNSKRFPLLKFDLSAFPAGSFPSTATLRVKSNSTMWGTLYVYRMSKSWTENGVNWLTRDGSAAWTFAGGDFHGDSVASLEDASDRFDIDVTDLVDAWMRGRYPNNGMRIASNLVWGDSANLISSDDSDAGDRPRLRVSYYLPCGVTGPED